MAAKKDNFWQELPPGFLALAPMAGITDLPFRLLCKEYGADVVYSEMASAAALYFGKAKKQDPLSNPTLRLLRTVPEEAPLVVQLFGREPEHFALAARIVSFGLSGRPAGIDINFGCPVPKVKKQGAGAVLMADLKQAREVLKAVIDNTDLPVSVKVRAEAGGTGVLKFLDSVSDLDIKAVMIHGRSLGQMFSGPIDLEIIKKAGDFFPGVIMANGGIGTAFGRPPGSFAWEQAEYYLKQSGAQGLGIAQGALGRPYIFKEIKDKAVMRIGREEYAALILRHAGLVDKYLGEPGFLELRKHLAWSVKGLKNAKQLRQQFIQIKSLADVKAILAE